MVKSDGAGGIGIVWRGWDGKTGVRLRLDSTGARLQVIENGTTRIERHDPSGGLNADQRHAIQIQDDGRTIRIARDGRSLDALTIDDPTGSDAPEIGFAGLTGGIAVEAFEAHPRQIPWPAAIKIDLPTVRRGEEILIHEDFQYRRDDLAGGIWRRLVGKGTIRVMGAGAEMVASAENPAPGRLLYGVRLVRSRFRRPHRRHRPPDPETRKRRQQPGRRRVLAGRMTTMSSSISG